MPEIHPDHFAEQYPNKINPKEYWYVLSPSNFFAINGGIFASLSSVSAKLAVDRHTGLIAEAVQKILPDADPTLVSFATRAIMLVCIGAANLGMWLSFTKALRYGSSTPRVVTIQTIANFITTAVLGIYLFGDSVSVRWCFGVSLIAVGLAFVATKEKNVAFVPESPDYAFEINGYKESESKTQ